MGGTEKKSVRELIEILETKLDAAKINNIQYSEQNFYYQKEMSRYQDKKRKEEARKKE